MSFNEQQAACPAIGTGCIEQESESVSSLAAGSLLDCQSLYLFLSRPRRFGKSLLTSTLHSYFSGRKELFRGLAIEKLEKEWIEYPVLHFDMSTAKHADKEQLLQELNLKLFGYEQIYGRLDEEVNPNQRLMGG